MGNCLACLDKQIKPKAQPKVVYYKGHLVAQAQIDKLERIRNAQVAARQSLSMHRSNVRQYRASIDQQRRALDGFFSRFSADAKAVMFAAKLRARAKRAAALGGVHGVLTITIKQAYDLMAADSNGLSDPYVIVRCGKQELKTKVVEKNLNPIWNEQHCLTGMAAMFQQHGLQLSVYDKDHFMKRDDHLGGLTVPLALQHGATTQFVERLPTKGSLAFAVGWTASSASPSATSVHAHLGHSPSCGLAGAPRPPPLPRSALRVETGLLRVVVQRGVGLLAGDLNGRSDPYVVCEAGGQQRKTKTIKGTLDPVWEETLELPGLLSDFEATGITLRVFDWDRIGSDDPLGTVHCSLADVGEGTRSSYREFVEALPTKGSVLFKVAWIADADDAMHPLYAAADDAKPASADRPLAAVGTVRVTLKRAYGLKAADSNGKSDPYVKVVHGAKTKKTKIIYKELDPVWNETVEFEALTMSELLREGLTLKVFDHDTIGFDDPLGELRVGCEELRRLDHVDYVERLPTQGTLVFAVAFDTSKSQPLPNPSLLKGLSSALGRVPPPPVAPSNAGFHVEVGGDNARYAPVKPADEGLEGDAMRQAARLAEHEVGVLRVLLKRAQGLKAADMNGKSDPYVKLSAATVKNKKSKTIKATLDPTWNETIDLPGRLGDFHTSGLQLRVFDWDFIGSDDPLGDLHVPLIHMHAENPTDYIEPLPTKGTMFFRVSWIPNS